MGPLMKFTTATIVAFASLFISACGGGDDRGGYDQGYADGYEKGKEAGIEQGKSEGKEEVCSDASLVEGLYETLQDNGLCD